MKNRSHRYNINRPWSRDRHKYTQVMKKFNNTEFES